MTTRDFYNFCVLMKNDSNILFTNNALHNSVYLGAFVLEGYVKILLIKNGATKPKGMDSESYGGHLNDGKMVQRLSTLHPTEFSGSILVSGHTKYPNKLLSSFYHINFRYEVAQWTNTSDCQDVQNEINNIVEELNNLRMQGAI